MNDLDLGAYCRAVETHLCRVNGGHLVRVVGPAFEMVRRWHADGVPLKIVMRGIERRAARAAARATAAVRRPLRLEFCEADVLDVFDEWRRAVGFALHAAPGADEAPGDEAVREGRSRTPSLPKHLERVAVKLTSFLSTTADAPRLTHRAEALLAEVGTLGQAARGARGEGRETVVARLEVLDDELLASLPQEAPAALFAAAVQEAREDLAPYEGRLPAAEFARMVDVAARRIARDRLGLPQLSPR
jgi:hypothetical protein